MTEYNRTPEAQALLSDVEAWCDRTGTLETAVGHVLFLHPGFVGLLRLRLTVSEEKENDVRGFLEEYPNGWRGQLPKTHANGTKPLRSAKIRLERGPLPGGPAPKNRPVDRDPCPRGGVRGDIGCAHSRVRLGTSM